MSKDNLEWLDEWYQRQCNGTWEHRQGVQLRQLDNPGWHLTINLAGTSAENSLPRKISLNTPAGDWIACSIAAHRFEGSGDPRKLEQIIGVFRKWVEAPSPALSVASRRRIP
ncbi:immunity 53 family protein [Paracidobacterium acidisoli]|uniref:Rhodanese-related sulfurtransferase n=1 Tax=Paracidobacterium acidisoli TaxID=2303751 RepID=A0A372IQ71_9BACT|nr:immunity 53 family protein [Paracidobacterium acidisoli]MBT9331211.1 immunity 53 family protein [Paracidobacterium acidisoli]